MVPPKESWLFLPLRKTHTQPQSHRCTPVVVYEESGSVCVDVYVTTAAAAVRRQDGELKQI